EGVLMHEVIPGGSWYRVSDPDQIRRRVELCNSQPTYILTIAKRIASVPVFASAPQQSDYVDLWHRTLKTASHVSPKTSNVGPGPTWKRHIPLPLNRVVRSLIEYIRGSTRENPSSGFNQSAYHRVSEDDLLRGRFRTHA